MIAFLLCMSCGLYLLYNQEGYPQIQLDTEHIDLGFLPLGETTTRHVELRNIGTGRLTIESIKASCSCTAVVANHSVIDPNAKTLLQLTVVGNSRVKSYATIDIASNDRMGPTKQIVLEFRSVKGIWANDGVVSFGRLDRSELESAKVGRIVIEGERTLDSTSLSYEADSCFQRVFKIPSPQELDGKLAFDVLIRDECPCGIITGKVRFKDDAGNFVDVSVGGYSDFRGVLDSIKPGLIHRRDGIFIGEASVFCVPGAEAEVHSTKVLGVESPHISVEHRDGEIVFGLKLQTPIDDDLVFLEIEFTSKHGPFSCLVPMSKADF